MSSEVLYRKWRPRSLAEVAGQEVVVRTLTNAIAGDKVAHAYLFSGPRGTGKTTTGRLLAMAVNCSQLKDGAPCSACDSCRAYLDGRALDLIELDAASNRGIDEIRSLREKANFAPAGGVDAYKVYLVDEVHMLTEPAFNALLKTLEEPPAHVIFVLATTESHKVPATVVSRCQRFDFRRIPLEASVGRLKFIAGEEGIECSEEALKQIARIATGSLRDAINLLEQLVDSYGNKLTDDQVREGLGLVVDARSVTLAAHALNGELAEGLAVISEVRDDGLDLRQFQRQVVAQMRGLLLAKAGAELSESWSEEEIAEMRALVAEVPTERIVATLRAFGEADLRADPLSPLPLELALASSILAAEAPASVPAAEAPAALRPQPQRQSRPAARPAAARAASGPPVKRPEPAAESSKPPAKQKQPAASKPAPATPAPAKPAPAKNVKDNGDAPAPSEQNTADAHEKPPVVPAGTPKEPPRDSNIGLDEVRARWPEIYDRTRELQFRAGALLNSGCGIIEASEAEIVFAFRHAMLLDRMEGDGGENVRALQQAVDEVLGAGRTVRCVLDPNVEIQRPGQRAGLVRAAEELVGEALASDDEGG
ncbi:MAG: DNA polymerase III subunit gamma/tau [Chloroflexi bacterium]|nr:DNA polymerase III subunit gamma/tau [Chloroflexota bacterium]